MTEIVQRRIEAMTIELEEMARTEIFSAEQCRIVLKRRKEFEHKINSVSKSLQNYIDYITYENIILKIIKLRRNKHHISEKKGSLEHKIINRIKNLYETAIQRHAYNLDLSLEYFKFCKDSLHINSATNIIQSILKYHSKNPEVWLIASKWYTQERKDSNTATALLHKGIAINKSNGALYIEIIKIETLRVYGAQHKDQLTEETVNRCNSLLQKCVESMFQNVLDVRSFLELLTFLEQHVSTMPVQNLIVQYLLEKQCNHVDVWHTLAQREKNGFNFDDSIERKTPKIKLMLCFKRYKEGLEKINSENRRALWTVYLDTLINLCQEEVGVANILKTKQLKEALEEACNLGFLTEKNYIKWLEFVDDKEAYNILIKGTQNLPESVELWKMRLRYNIINDNKKEIMTVFNAGIAALQDQALPLYYAVLKYMILWCTKDEINFFYQNAVVQSKTISEVFKPKYLEWLALHRNLEAARTVYNKLAYQQPYCKGLHETMYLLETTRHHEKPAADFSKWENILTLAIEQFGTEDVDVWLNYISFYKHYNILSDVTNKIQIILNKAKESLSEYMYITLEEKVQNC